MERRYYTVKPSIMITCFKKNRRNLILQGINGQGFMPLMMNIDGFRYRYSEPFLEIWVKVHNHQYHRKVVMQRKSNEN